MVSAENQPCPFSISATAFRQGSSRGVDTLTDIATARRWKRGERRPPATSLMILAEDLGAVSIPPGRDDAFARANILSPESCGATPGEIMALSLMRLQITSYQRDQRRNSTPSRNSLSRELSAHPLWVFPTCRVDEVRARGLSSGRATHELTLCCQ